MGKTESLFRRLLPLPPLLALPCGVHAQFYDSVIKTSSLGLLLTLAAATALAEQPSWTYSNIVIRVVTSTNAVTFTDLRGHTYSNVTVKLIPYGLGWYAKDGSEGRLAITNLDEVTLADITGLSTNQVAYLIYKKAMEDTAYIPQEATNTTPWWLAPYPHGLNERVMAKPEGKPPPTMYSPMMYEMHQWLNQDQALRDRQRSREMNERMQEMQTRAEQEMNKQLQKMQTRPVQKIPVSTRP